MKFAAHPLILALAGAMASLRPQPGTQGIDLNKYWLHAFQTALAAREIGRALRFGHEQAFFAGLIHDLGKLVMAVLYPEVVQKLLMDIGDVMRESYQSQPKQ